MAKSKKQSAGSVEKAASVLSFERVLDISDGFFWQENSQDKTSKPSIVTVKEKSVRGTISNRLKNEVANDPVKLDAEIQKANLQTVDYSYLDENNDTLIVKFTCKVLPFTGKPCICNNQNYAQKLANAINDYKQNQGLSELAKRYAVNMINGRWLWRNRVGAEKIAIKITFNQEVLDFENAKEFGLNQFEFENEKLNKLANWIEQGLNDEQFVILSVEARAIMGYAQEVYPSQEFIPDNENQKSKKKEKGSKSKVLYRVGDSSKNHAGLHSQKIGNAIRTIDTWYPDNEKEENDLDLFGKPEVKQAIAVETYGTVTTLGHPFRKEQNFYQLFDDWVVRDKKPDINQQHYVIAVLIRGGLFGEKSDDKQEKSEE